MFFILKKKISLLFSENFFIIYKPNQKKYFDWAFTCYTN